MIQSLKRGGEGEERRGRQTGKGDDGKDEEPKMGRGRGRREEVRENFQNSPC